MKCAQKSALFIAALALATAQRAPAFDGGALMAMMATVRESTVAFEETKQVAALNAPLVRRGTMRYVRPDRLQMRVEQPYFERLEITGSQVTIENRKGRREFDLGAVPAAAAWVESLRATLSGDATALERHYRVDVRGTADDWTLALHPRDRTLAQRVERIDLAGSNAQIMRVTIEEPQGDRTTLVLTPKDAQ